MNQSLGRIDGAAYLFNGYGMKFTAKVNIQPARTFFQELAFAARQSLPDTIRGEATAIVMQSMKWTASTKKSEVAKQAMRKGVASFRGAGGTFGGTTNISKRRGEAGRQWMVGLRGKGDAAIPMGKWDGTLNALKDGKKSSGTTGKTFTRGAKGTRKYKKSFTPNGWRARDSDWAEFKRKWAQDKDETKKYIKARQDASGITKRSWLEIIDSIQGANTSGIPDFVVRARPISGKMRKVGFVEEVGAGTPKFALYMENQSGLAVKTGGARKLASAITGRRKYFMENMKRGVFDDMKSVAKKYSWVKVN